jgi:histidine ammonia-lyase
MSDSIIAFTGHEGFPPTKPRFVSGWPVTEETTQEVKLGPSGTTLADVVAVARQGAAVRLTPGALEVIEQSRRTVEELASAATPAYGISTGFGALATGHIPAERREDLQASLIRSHAAGLGAPAEPEVVRALMFLRLKTLASGRTGVRPVVAQARPACSMPG